MRNKTILIKCTQLLYKINVKENIFFGYRKLATIYIQQYEINAYTDSRSKSHFVILKFWLIKNAWIAKKHYLHSAANYSLIRNMFVTFLRNMIHGNQLFYS